MPGARSGGAASRSACSPGESRAFSSPRTTSPRITLLALALLLASACATAPAVPCEPPAAAAAEADPLADATIPALPDWTDKYGGSDNNGDVRFFNISGLMARYDLARWQAAEVQNHYRDLSRAKAAGGPAAWFAEAVRRVQAGDFESGYDAERIANASFVVVFDLDETLYDQRVKAAEGCHDLVAVQPGGKRRSIKLVPGWAEAFTRIYELGGAIVIFSANLDDPTRANLTAWTWDGVPLLEHKKIAAVMTNSYLVMQSKHEGPGAKKPRKGHPVATPSKDVRLFDESLAKVIIVDNHPLRIFHHANTRRFHEFQADDYCAADAPLKAAIAGAMPQVVAEIEDAVAWMKAHGGTFAAAYRPYSMLGQDVVDALVDGGLSEEDAITYVREHPEVVHDSY